MNLRLLDACMPIAPSVPNTKIKNFEASLKSLNVSHWLKMFKLYVIFCLKFPEDPALTPRSENRAQCLSMAENLPR